MELALGFFLTEAMNQFFRRVLRGSLPAAILSIGPSGTDSKIKGKENVTGIMFSQSNYMDMFHAQLSKIKAAVILHLHFIICIWGKCRLILIAVFITGRAFTSIAQGPPLKSLLFVCSSETFLC